MALNEASSRQMFNLAIRKAKDGLQIVRYVNGFKSEPVVILRGISSNAEVEKKMERAISIIAQTSTQYGVLVQLEDKGRTVEAVLALEDAGISNSEVRVQANGTMYFLCTADDEASAERTIKEKLNDSGIAVKENGIAIVDKKHLPKDDNTAEEPKDAIEHGPAVPVKVDTPNTVESSDKEDYAIYAEMLENPNNFPHPSEQALFKDLQAKYGKVKINAAETKFEAPVNEIRDIKEVFETLANTQGPFESDAEILAILSPQFDFNTIVSFIADNQDLITKYIK